MGEELLELVPMEQIALVALSAVILLLFMTYIRISLRTRDRVIVKLTQDLDMVYNGVFGLFDRIVQLETQAASKPASAPIKGTRINFSFDRARRLIQEGADVQRLISECELSKGEADLMVHLHRIKGSRFSDYGKVLM